jgi:hypothetical protein
MTIGQKESGWNEKDSKEDRERKTTDDGLRQGSISEVTASFALGRVVKRSLHIDWVVRSLRLTLLSPR